MGDIFCKSRVCRLPESFVQIKREVETLSNFVRNLGCLSTCT